MAKTPKKSDVEQASSIELAADRDRTGPGVGKPGPTITPDVDQAAPGKPKPSKEAGDLPDAIRNRYMHETDPLSGHVRLYRDATTKDAVIVDRGDKLSTPETNTAVIRDMLATAEHRSWATIQVKGEPEFRREVWLQGSARGLDVRGYEPTERDLQELDRMRKSRAENAPAPVRSDRDDDLKSGAKAQPERPDYDKGVSGKVVDMGRSPYQDKPDAKPQPFVTLETGGRVHTVWGVKLGAELEKAGVKIGDTIELRRTGVERVTIDLKGKDDQGRPVDRPTEVTRNTWQVSADRFRAGSDAGTADPALKGAQATLRAAETLASGIKNPEERRKVLDRTQDAIATKLERGSTFQPPKVREMQARQTQVEKAVDRKGGSGGTTARNTGSDRDPRPDAPQRTRSR